MNNEDILLSICIPTYNRGEVLRKVLDNITSNKAFDERVEIVISDNHSTDNTREIVMLFTSKYNNIKYYCNDSNLKDENLWKVLTYATGSYIKLQNDYLGFTENGLDFIKQSIIQYQGKHLLFTGGSVDSVKSRGIITCDNIQDFTYKMATCKTFMPMFGLWKEELKLIDNPLQERETKLLQVDWYYKFLTKSFSSEILLFNNDIYFSYQELAKRGGYNWFYIHVLKYYSILEKYTKNGIITNSALRKDKINCLKHFSKSDLKFVFIYKPDFFDFDTKNSFKILFMHFKKIPLFYLYCFLYPFYKFAYPYYYIKYSNGWIHNFIKKMIKRGR